METIAAKRLTPETRRQNLEVLRPENVVYLGRLAIRSEYLGINDPITHLYQYLEKGEDSLIGIQEDIETDISERLPNTPFVNQVEFDYSGDDFVSKKDKISMNQMTKVNLNIFTQESSTNPGMNEELVRARTEALEVEKLIKWFDSASVGEYMIFESLPIGSQDFAISRIYQKIGNSRLEGNFISLHSPNVNIFNKLRRGLVLRDAGDTAAEILENEYTIDNENLYDSDIFIKHYVGLYDNILKEVTGREYIFGINTINRSYVINGLQKVKNQPKLTSIYLDTIKTIASGQGKVNGELLRITNKLGIDSGLVLGQDISVKAARGILKNVIRAISSVIDKADESLLKNLEDASIDSDASYDAVSHFGNQARSSGETYESNGCPEFNRTDQNSNSDNNSESSILNNSFNNVRSLDNFGKAKIGVCRITNCPSRGESSWWISRTLVGGCDVCVKCHKLFNNGKSPEKIHAINKQVKEVELQKVA